VSAPDSVVQLAAGLAAALTPAAAPAAACTLLLGAAVEARAGLRALAGCGAALCAGYVIGALACGAPLHWGSRASWSLSGALWIAAGLWLAPPRTRRPAPTPARPVTRLRGVAMAPVCTLLGSLLAWARPPYLGPTLALRLTVGGPAVLAGGVEPPALRSVITVDHFGTAIALAVVAVVAGGTLGRSLRALRAPGLAAAGLIALGLLQAAGLYGRFIGTLLRRWPLGPLG
jgi:hypothetical protein